MMVRSSSDVMLKVRLRRRTAYLAKLKASGKHYGHGGFGGKGLDRFDQDREQTERTQRKAFGEPVEEEKSIFDEDVEVKPEVSAQIEQLDVEIKRGPAPDGRRPVQHRGCVVGLGSRPSSDG